MIVRKKSKGVLRMGAVMVVMMLAVGAWAMEHPGNETGGGHGEHGQIKGSTATVEAVQKSLQGFIAKDAQLKGSFLIQNPTDTDVWSLNVDKVHPIRKIDDGHYFVCADFKGWRVSQKERGTEDTLDVDFFLNQQGKAWDVSMIELHKENGVERDRPYACPMHKDIVSASPRKKCPVCGMNLEKKANR